MAYQIEYTTRFKKEYKLAKKRGREKYKDHPLVSNWSGYRECHIQSDWLLIYKYKDNELILSLTATGSHSDLF